MNPLGSFLKWVNDIEATKKDFHNFLMSRVEDEVDGLLFDEELKKAGL